MSMLLARSYNVLERQPYMACEAAAVLAILIYPSREPVQFACMFKLLPFGSACNATS